MCNSNIKKLCVTLVFVLNLSIGWQALAADVALQWDRSAGAEGYVIDSSVDGGVTWAGSQATGAAGEDPERGVYTYIDAAEDGLVLFRISAVNATQTATRRWSGAWYNHLNLPIPTPGGAGVP